jgi:rhodanese-related sulfurtransferase
MGFVMPSNTEISAAQLARRVGLPDAPILIDVRLDEDIATDPRRLPCARFRPHRTVADWDGEYAGRDVVVICQKGLKLSQGVAAWLRHAGVRAETLEGGFEAWRAAGAPLVKPDALPAPLADGRSLWVTRARPKIDRIACPWLIRRYVDPDAVFLFVAASEVEAVADRFGATPFDIDGVFWSHRGEECTFDLMLREFGLMAGPLERLAAIVRAADTSQLDLVPQASGFLAVSLGLSRMYRDDLEQLDAGMLLYDAMFRWCRDAVDETHNWPAKA